MQNPAFDQFGMRQYNRPHGSSSGVILRLAELDVHAALGRAGTTREPADHAVFDQRVNGLLNLCLGQQPHRVAAAMPVSMAAIAAGSTTRWVRHEIVDTN